MSVPMPVPVPASRLAPPSPPRRGRSQRGPGGPRAAPGAQRCPLPAAEPPGALPRPVGRCQPRGGRGLSGARKGGGGAAQPGQGQDGARSTPGLGWGQGRVAVWCNLEMSSGRGTACCLGNGSTSARCCGDEKSSCKCCQQCTENCFAGKHRLKHHLYKSCESIIYGSVLLLCLFYTLHSFSTPRGIIAGADF